MEAVNTARKQGELLIKAQDKVPVSNKIRHQSFQET